MSQRMMLHPAPARPELDALIERAKRLPPMTKEQIERQRRSWVIGNMLLSHPEMTREQVEKIYDEVTMTDTGGKGATPTDPDMQEMEPQDPIFQDEAGWWFWDETWASKHGPYATEEDARKMLDEYCQELLGDPNDPV